MSYFPNIEKKTGKTIADFVDLAIEKGLDDPEIKPAVRMAWLKADHGLGHGHALAMHHAIREALLERNGVKVENPIAGSKPARP